MSYAVSDRTKHDLCVALKSLMAQKPLEKITIRELTERCGMVRQAFYYHFEDLYDLVKWMFQEEAMVLLQRQAGVLLWQEGILQLFQYVQENRAVCLCALKSLGREHLKRFFHEEIYAIIHRTVVELAQELAIPEGQADRDLITQFYVIALVGMMESYLTGELDVTPERLIQFVDGMLQDQIAGAAGRMNQTPPPWISGPKPQTAGEKTAPA